MIELRQSTAGQEIPLGYFLDSTDGDTEETALTIANTDIKLWKWGATTLTNKNSGGAAHISNGVYYCTLDDTDTNTPGTLVVFVHVSGALACKVVCSVLPTNVWDSKYSTDYLQVDVVQLGGDTQSGTDLKDFADAGYDPATNKIEGIKLADACTANSDMRGTDNAALASVCTEGRLSELDAANIPSDLDAVLTDTNELQTDWVNDGRLDALIDGIKTKTDALNFDGSNVLADVMAMNTDVITAAAIAAAAIDKIWDEQPDNIAVAFRLILERIYRNEMNKMNITDATGSVALRNEADDANIMTRTISDDDTTTVRTVASWS